MRLIGVPSILALLATGVCAHASGEQPTVEIVVAGAGIGAADLQKTLSDDFVRQHISTNMVRQAELDPSQVVDPPAGVAPIAVRVWIDLKRPGLAVLYFTDVTWQRILVRRVSMPHALDEVEREELALVVRSAVGALLAGEVIGTSRQEVRDSLVGRQSRTVVAAVPVRPEGLRLRVPGWIFYEAQIFSGNPNVWQGPGIGIAVTGTGNFRLGGQVSVQYRAPMTVQGNGIDARFQAIATRAMARADWTAGNLSLSGLVGLGADLMFIQPMLSQGAVGTADSARWDAKPLVRAGVSPAVKLSKSLFLALQVGVDIDLVKTNYTASSDAGTYSVFSPWPVRPYVSLELGETLISGN